ncbi:MAG: A/G-specific adenine glycosylase [Verrucomicrobiales bacterium]|nr:A/G-specific adenine glycosylase [Verrucomicrobiales bacterium]MCP5557764.1 A/G-specific adenine glycosylase [Verrucomicrobiaceae bacterium]
MKKQPDLQRLANSIVAWFQANGRDYPWRQTRDPYEVLVAEIMLQQTQIATVLGRGYYTRWLEKFPDFISLAAANEDAVLKAWEGLGYYRRARNLQKLAQAIVTQHNGVMPADPAQVLALPGIGPYTAGAIASFAFGLHEPIVDGNVARVLARVFDDDTPVDSTAGIKRQWDIARKLVHGASDPRAFNSGLMELGQTVCKPGQPDCIACPIKASCQTKRAPELPVKKPARTLTEVDEHVFFHRTPEGILLEQEAGSRRTGMWKLPAVPNTLSESERGPILLKLRYGITRYRVTLWVHEPSRALVQNVTVQYFSAAEVAALAVAAPYRRALLMLECDVAAASPWSS